ncbi:dTDP-4-dehydrorhamnose 3,5-epimerase [Dasania marina]|uniref:dTDP-4-dehydrorhamnose 3,5-epimerase n=1 Tax=Dasania marina TaxID=471499 RepID=UPI00037CEE20|nr:dTDP-4-dehydrorhamnose 3,5-epimerase [Dasania marina]
MKFKREIIADVQLISLDPMVDERGFFARAFCEKEFAEQGLPTHFEQMNLSRNPKKHTLRGFHFQLPPYQEGKLVRCVAGSIYDIAVDVRPQSPTFGQACGAYLSAEEGNMFYVPEGCAHAFISLEDNTDVLYMATQSYRPGVEQGIAYNDPFIKIELPVVPALISDKDSDWPTFDIPAHEKSWRQG